jgi:hypothetical protein
LFGTRWSCPNGTIAQTLAASSPIDWNCDGNASETDVAVNLNQGWDGTTTPINETFGTFFDWAGLSYGGGGQLGVGARSTTQIAQIAASSDVTGELTLAQDNLIPDPYKVAVIGSGGDIGMPGYTTSYTVTIANLGLSTDVYTITLTSTLGWANLTSLPTAVALAPGEIHDIAVPITIPLTATSADMDILRVAATSNSNPKLWSSHFLRTAVLNTLYLPLTRK